MYTLKPDGKTPIVGDQDDGRLLPFGFEENIDYRYLLSLGSILFNNKDFKYYGSGYSVYCAMLGGVNSREKYENIIHESTPIRSKAFPDAGFYLLRKDDNYLLFNVSGKGLYPELPSGTHTHSDLLSFELFTKGKTFLLDPGSYVYTANADVRKLFRSTSMHNTVTIDGESQNVIRKEVLWDFERNAIPEILNWETSEIFDKIVASHTGYLRLKHPVIHKRAVIFEKDKLIWNIKDEFSGEGCHNFEWYFHFDSGIDFFINSKEVITKCNDGNNIMITFRSDKNLTFRKENSFVSKSYGSIRESYVLVAELFSDCPIEVNITIRSITTYETNIKE
jgi:hypothetical protein